MSPNHRRLRHLILGAVATVLSLLGAPSPAAEVIYYHTDTAGPPLLASDADGQVLWYERHRPYGERLLHEDPRPLRRGYTGQPEEGELGLNYYGARWYDPAIGRFLGLDPLGVDPADLGSFNRYCYARNSPYRNVDPDGEAAILAVLAAVAVAGVTVYDMSQQPQVPFASGATFASAGPLDAVAGVGGVASAARLGVGAVAGATKSVGKASDNVIHVTKDGVALPPRPKYKIPDNYVQNPHRPGNYGEIVNGKFKERLRIDPPTPPGKKGPNYSHYYKNGKGTHYSPRPGDSDPGF